jgi:hypothetical protein
MSAPTDVPEDIMATTTRFAAALTAGLITFGLATAPATALRVPPIEHGGAIFTDEPIENTSLLLSMGRVAAHTATAPVVVPELIMSAGRLPR